MTTTAYIIQGLRARAAVLLRRAASRALSVAQSCALTATAYRALARAAQLRADLMQRVSQIGPMIDECERAAAYAAVASTFAYAADLRGA
jgi:hypothetical protein